MVKLGKLKYNPVKVSPETETFMKLKKLKKLEFLSYHPHDLPKCVCEPLVKDYQFQASKPNFKPFRITCPKSKDILYKQHQIFCGKCSETVGYLYTRNAKTAFTDFCDFHYYNYAEGGRWFGCRTAQISPVDLVLRFEVWLGSLELVILD